MTDATDGDLLRRSASGDQAAFTELVDRHGASVHRLLLSLASRPEDAEDALQETFVAAWKGADSFRGGDSARAWLLTIARNALRKQHRRRAGQPSSFESVEQLGAKAGWGATDGPARRFEAREQLSWALGTLGYEEREVLILRDIEGLSGAEAAEALELTLPALKSRLHRARLHLMAALRGAEE